LRRTAASREIFPGWGGTETRLAEPAAAHAAAEQLDHRPVVHDVQKRHDEALRIKHTVKVGNHALFHHGGRAFACRDRLNRPVVTIRYRVEGRHVQSFDARGPAEQFLLVPALAPGPKAEVEELAADFLTLAERENIDKAGERLGFEAQGPPATTSGNAAVRSSARTGSPARSSISSTVV
jgi:hypothetical protein